uniref:Oxytocin n=1 Tax=Oncorhynchus kisutch TaxID=8019 RepID=A0A8C7DVV2_ONCKI
MSVAPVSALCLLFLLSVCTACYISNCPIGGKRSALDVPSRKCMSCGPGDRGHCFGPSICCGEGMGCYMGSPEAASCVEENYLTSPCEYNISGVRAVKGLIQRYKPTACERNPCDPYKPTVLCLLK